MFLKEYGIDYDENYLWSDWVALSGRLLIGWQNPGRCPGLK
jgi:hypothetical protein